MTKGEVSALVTLLCACYPNARVPDGTVVAYETFLVELDRDRAQLAIANVIRTSKFFPSIAEVVLAYEALAPREEPHAGRYLGPRYTGRIMAPRELKAELDSFLETYK